MNKLTVILILACMTGSGLLFAQDNWGGSRNRNRNRVPQPMTAETAKKWTSVQAELKKKYPERFAEIEKLARTNIPLAMQKMSELAREAKIETPRNSFSRGAQKRSSGDRPGPGFGPPPDFGGEFRRPRGEMPGNNRQMAENQIKEKFPAEYAKADKMRSDAEVQLQALAKKAGVTLPDTMETRMKKMQAVRIKYKAEFDEIAKLRQTDPQAAMERTMEIYKREGIDFMGGNRGRFQDHGNNPEREQTPPPRRGNPMMNKMRAIQKAYPEEMKKLRAIRREDPEAYRRGILELAARYDREHSGKAEK